MFSKETVKPTFVSVIGIVSVFANEVIIVTTVQIDSLATCRDRITIDSITMKPFVTLTCEAELSVGTGGIRVTVIISSRTFVFWNDFNTVVTSIELESTFTAAFEFCFIHYISHYGILELVSESNHEFTSTKHDSSEKIRTALA